MPPTQSWGATFEPASQGRSLLGSIRKLGRKSSNSSTRSQEASSNPDTLILLSPATPSFRGPADLAANAANSMPSRSPNPFSNPSPATRRPDRHGMNAFSVPSNEPPPAYTPSPTAATGPSIISPPADFSGSDSRQPYSPFSVTASTETMAASEDPYIFLSTFDTTLLIDDSGSMVGRSWREVLQALSIIAPIVTAHDSDGMDVYFLNHKSNSLGDPATGIAPGGYRGIKRASTVTEIFETVRPQGGTPTGTRVHNILKPYLARLEKFMAEGKEMKPLNLIVLTDGVPSDDVESVILSVAKKLDKLDAPPHQVGVQFFQVGNEEGAKEALEELDDEISSLVEGGVRDIVDTVTWTGGAAASEGGIGLTGDSVLKAVLGAVVRRLDRRPANGVVGRRR